MIFRENISRGPDEFSEWANLCRSCLHKSLLKQLFNLKVLVHSAFVCKNSVLKSLAGAFQAHSVRKQFQARVPLLKKREKKTACQNLNKLYGAAPLQHRGSVRRQVLSAAENTDCTGFSRCAAKSTWCPLRSTRTLHSIQDLAYILQVTSCAFQQSLLKWHLALCPCTGSTWRSAAGAENLPRLNPAGQVQQPIHRNTGQAKGA